MKKIEALLFVSVIGLTIWNIQLRETVQSLQQTAKSQIKTLPVVSSHPFHKVAIKPVIHSASDATEKAFNKLGLTLANPVRVIADVVGFQQPPYYECQLLCNISMHNAYKSVTMSFRLEKNLSISSLSIDGKPVPLTEPIYGLPLGDDGLMKDIELVIWSGANNDFTNNGDVGNGYIHKDRVSKGEKLTVVLKREGTFISHRESNTF